MRLPSGGASLGFMPQRRRRIGLRVRRCEPIHSASRFSSAGLVPGRTRRFPSSQRGVSCAGFRAVATPLSILISCWRNVPSRGASRLRVPARSVLGRAAPSTFIAIASQNRRQRLPLRRIHSRRPGLSLAEASCSSLAWFLLRFPRLLCARSLVAVLGGEGATLRFSVHYGLVAASVGQGGSPLPAVCPRAPAAPFSVL